MHREKVGTLNPRGSRAGAAGGWGAEAAAVTAAVKALVGVAAPEHRWVSAQRKVTRWWQLPDPQSGHFGACLQVWSCVCHQVGVHRQRLSPSQAENEFGFWILSEVLVDLERICAAAGWGLEAAAWNRNTQGVFLLRGGGTFPL